MKFIADSPEDQDREEGREDESKSTAGNGSDQRNEVVKVRHKEGNESCKKVYNNFKDKNVCGRKTACYTVINYCKTIIIGLS